MDESDRESPVGFEELYDELLSTSDGDADSHLTDSSLLDEEDVAPGQVMNNEQATDDSDQSGSVRRAEVGNAASYSWVNRGSSSGTEMLRFNRDTELLHIYPMISRGSTHENPFDQIVELQIEAPGWDPDRHSVESDRYGLLRVLGLPKGFSAVWLFGLGIQRIYRGIVETIEEQTACSIVRFVTSEAEGPDRDVFCISLERFDAYRATVDRNRGRGNTAVRRVIEAERHNAVADLFGLTPTQPRYGRNPVIQALTEEVETGHVTSPEDRLTMVNETVLAAPQVAQESPQQFGRLREDIELVSLQVLIEQFERSLIGRSNEGFWQRFFTTNPFALQQLFSAPLLVLGGLVHVRGADALGQGGRIADFLCVNTVTRSAIVVEIKTPATRLMSASAYRGSGMATVYATSTELSGAVSQIQAQMESVSRDLKEVPQFGAIDKWHVRGAVVIGNVSTLNDEQRASFLRYREGLTAVSILGYDEVGERLKGLRDMLESPPTQENAFGDDDDSEDS
ncbi:Shedu anti-phage system protein SduA domain-containing protein [Clavibacter zhangzhiyongii]|uniref:DUF4263 domain-containing protein n=1 Tax=Clavibacter zhangzhiyongii TaxID=2768071 RepID=A0A7L7YYJ6_9MICO|nr:Shedu anti-phage system protein SduA domain-containing protein [Clavibacter zhangzhiyongii]QOD42542.1 DUF4263 domain-containing protein [Clavibacter zhangzhiyongii]